SVVTKLLNPLRRPVARWIRAGRKQGRRDVRGLPQLRPIRCPGTSRHLPPRSGTWRCQESCEGDALPLFRRVLAHMPPTSPLLLAGLVGLCGVRATASSRPRGEEYRRRVEAQIPAAIALVCWHMRSEERLQSEFRL